MDKNANIIELVINNALETQLSRIEEQDFSEMKEEDIKEMNENTSRIVKLENVMKSMVSNEAYKVFLEIDDLMTRNSSIQIQYIFKKGVIEGLTTFEYLKAVRKCVYLPEMKL